MHSDDSRPMRKLWQIQIHLSTALLLTFAASGLLWLNCGRHKPYTVSYESSGDYHGSYRILGWPFEITRLDTTGLEVDTSADPSAVLLPSPYLEYDWKRVWADAAVALCFLTALACFLEWRIRRRNYI